MSLFGGGGSAAISPSPPSSPSFPSGDDDISDFSIEEIRHPSPLNPLRQSSEVDSKYQSDAGDEQQRDYDGNADYKNIDGKDDQEEDQEQTNATRSLIKARTWRHYTAADRDIHSSLLALRSQDLSAHLYNTHVLKSCLRPPTAVANIKPYARKARWIPRDQVTGERPWMPDVSWTAWPLQTEHVPSPDGFAGTWGSQPYRAAGGVRDRTSKGLEEEMSAVFLRQAKDMWMRRQPGRILRHTPEETFKRSRTRSVSRGPSTEGDLDEAKVSSSIHAASSSTTQDPDASVIEVSAPVSGQRSSRRSSVASSSHNPAGSSSRVTSPSVKQEDVYEEDGSDVDFARPVFSADDDRSNKTLRPTVRHVMSKLDDLLLALHHQRAGQDVRGKATGYTSDDSMRSASLGRSRPGRSRSETKQRPRPKRTAAERDKDLSNADPFEGKTEDTSSDISLSDSDASELALKSSGKKSSEKDTPAIPRTRPLVPRDWSEVLGVTVMSGWDEKVVSRAAKRCEALFGEKMLFRTFPESGPVVEGDASASNKGAEHDEPDSAAAMFACPFAMCDRHADPYERGWRWREHLVRKHKLQKSEIERYQAQIVVRASAIVPETGSGNVGSKGRFRQKILDYNPMRWQPPTPLTCPHCGDLSPVYPKISRLLDHLKRTHKYDPRVEKVPARATSRSKKEPGQKSRQASSSLSLDPDAENDDEGALDEIEEADSEDVTDFDDAEEMLGGVHLDGFLQPIHYAGARGKDKAPRLERAKDKRSKEQRKAAKKSNKRKRDLMADEEERLSSQHHLQPL